MVFNGFWVCFFPNASQCCIVILMIFLDDNYFSVDGVVWIVLLRMSSSLDLYIFLLSFSMYHLTIHHPLLCKGSSLALSTPCFDPV